MMTIKQFMKEHDLTWKYAHVETVLERTYPGSIINIRLFILGKSVNKQTFLLISRRAAEVYLSNEAELETLIVTYLEGTNRYAIISPKKYKSVSWDDVHQKYELESNMPDYIYKSVAVAFAKAFVLKDASLLGPFISVKTNLIIYKENKLSGTQCILDYFANWMERATKENLNVMVAVKWQSNQCRPAVYIKPTNSKEMVLLFRVKDGVLADIVFAPSFLQDGGRTFHYLNLPPYSVDFISNILGGNEKPQNYHLPCPICGLESKSLDWYKIQIPMGAHGYAGTVSICTSCKKVVELVADTRMEYDEPQWTVSKNSYPETEPVFIPKLLGIKSFETEGEKVRFYPYDER